MEKNITLLRAIKKHYFSQSLNKGEITREFLEKLREQHVPDSEAYQRFFEAQVNTLVGTQGYSQKVAQNPELMEMHRLGELVAIGLLTLPIYAGEEIGEIITDSGLEIAAERYIQEGHAFHKEANRLSSYEWLQLPLILGEFSPHVMVQPGKGLEVYDNLLFRTGYTGLFAAANESKQMKAER